MLDQFRRVSEQNRVPFFCVDSLDFTKTPKGFTTRLLTILQVEVLDEKSETELLQEAIRQLNKKAEAGGIVLAIDTYEEINELDDWIRQSFLVGLSNNILIVLSGRFPLKGGWVLSPAWRRLIKFLLLPSFDYETCMQYTSRFGNYDDSFVRKSFMITKGHPLTFSLFMSLIEMEEMTDTPTFNKIRFDSLEPTQFFEFSTISTLNKCLIKRGLSTLQI
ncbi:hypothetical protein QNH20_24580 [Neobacillus sp. WH10]|uniref:hypothetical protein n=1 Tax=Neobacillus sp. WH10 TaxID=3047873 RepID=UPI0024C102CF|nr:hypothetical protein [Neobacillus sp. WH10]WHY77214.1 hypothetical protein QNH20_24580 [Neobacillus sp. WH10]